MLESQSVYRTSISLVLLALCAIVACRPAKSVAPGSMEGTVYVSPKVTSSSCEAFVLGTNLTARCDSNGHFSFARVPPGQWKLQVFSDAVTAQNRATLLTNKVVAPITSNQLTIIPDLLLSQAGLVSGAITQGGAPADSKLLSTVGVAVDSSGEAVVPSSGGDYLLDLVPPGNQRIVLVVPGRGTAVQDPVTVEPKRLTPNVDFDLGAVSNLPASLTGMAQRAYTSGSQANIQIRLVNEQTGTLLGPLATDASGDFSFGQVAPGIYTLEGDDASTGSQAKLSGVVLASGDHKTLDVTLTLIKPSDLGGADGGDGSYPFAYPDGGLDLSNFGAPGGGNLSEVACALPSDCPGAFCNNHVCGICRSSVECPSTQYCDPGGTGSCLTQTHPFIAGTSMHVGRHRHASTVLGDGRILVAGGYNNAYLYSSEVYDPPTSTWTTVGNMASPRNYFAMVTLPTGKVLAAGGRINDNTTVTSAEIWDPATQNWSPTGSMTYGHGFTTMTLLRNGKVLVTGNVSGGTAAQSSSAELYDPNSGLWSSAGSMSMVRYQQTAHLLSSGKVLVVGGGTATCELYDPATGTWTPTGTMHDSRTSHASVLLTDGRVLAAGGFVTSSEIYDPATGQWTSTSSLHSSQFSHQLTLLPDANVLMTGVYQPTAELFNVQAGTWTPAPPMARERYLHTAHLLSNGKAFIIGGAGNTGYLYYPWTELY